MLLMTRLSLCQRHHAPLCHNAPLVCIVHHRLPLNLHLHWRTCPPCISAEDIRAQLSAAAAATGTLAERLPLGGYSQQAASEAAKASGQHGPAQPQAAG
jgi:hypothetical protein